MRGFLWLLAAVLAAIGIGVGVEAGQGPAGYAGAGNGFEAAFPAAPTRSVHHLAGGLTLHLWRAQQGAGQFAVAEITAPIHALTASEVTQLHRAECRLLSVLPCRTGYAPLTATRDDHCATTAHNVVLDGLTGSVSFGLGGAGPGGVARCVGVEGAGRPGLGWIALAAAPRDDRVIRAFLDSFQPQPGRG